MFNAIIVHFFLAAFDSHDDLVLNRVDGQRAVHGGNSVVGGHVRFAALDDDVGGHHLISRGRQGQGKGMSAHQSIFSSYRNRFVVYFGAEGFAVGDGLVVGCDGDRPGVDGKRYRSGTDEGIYPPHNFIIGDSGNDNISRTGICVVRITTNCNPISEIKIIW